MGTKDNFHQALHEVFPFYKNDKPGSDDNSNLSTIMGQTALNSEKITPIMTATVPQDSESEPESDSDSDNTVQNLPVIETTYITKDTKIIGTINSSSNIDLGGEVTILISVVKLSAMSKANTGSGSPAKSKVILKEKM